MPATMIGLDFSGIQVVLVGGGPVTARRVLKLTAAGAHIRVVAPEICAELEDLRMQNVEFDWIAKSFAPEHLAGAWFVTTCTGNPEVDLWVAQECEDRHIWCVSSGQAALGTARYAAEVQVDDRSIGILAIGVNSHTQANPKHCIRVARTAEQIIQSAVDRGEFQNLCPETIAVSLTSAT